MFWRDPGKRLVENLYAYRMAKARKGPLAALRRAYCKLAHIFLSAVTGSEIDRDATIARSVRLPHPNGVVIHGAAVIGEECMIMQQVTIGQVGASSAPKVGRGAYFGAGAKVLGEIEIGDEARIGANAVVLEDVPAGATAVGVPARILKR